MTQQISFLHIHLQNSRRACVGWRFREGNLEFGMALCHPDEKYYLKTEARKHATIAVNERPNTIPLFVLKSLAIAEISVAMSEIEEELPIGLKGINVMCAQLDKFVFEAPPEKSFELLRGEFIENTILVAIDSRRRPRRVWAGGYTFTLEDFQRESQ